MNENVGGIGVLISRYRLIWLVLFSVVFIGIDQVSKKWAQATLAIPKFDSFAQNAKPNFDLSRLSFEPHISKQIEIVPNFLNFIYRENSAAAFSITSSFPDWFRWPFLLTISTIASLAFLIWYFRIKEHDGLLLTSLCLIMAGAVGNLIDRATLGYVIDFVDVYGGFLGYPRAHWATFNIADTCIVVGAIGVMIRAFKKNPA